MVTKVLYNLMGIKPSGHKENLGFKLVNQKEPALVGVLNDLKAREVFKTF